MDLSITIRELKEEKRRLDRVIHTLEQMIAKGEPAGHPNIEIRVSRRGRKSMGEAERREVSERMARYWAARRAAKQGLTDAEPKSAISESAPMMLSA